ncbi:MAG: hypothetical protein GWN07_15525, partial [Actinobacteria bacterium]|nr:hypothetical protein [Actinomycetota bacterium]NIS31810.1 hypothetical protein [Actinomycetota bacterium]NIU66900.1 hypothetical protein [Actinomycetota bacterium]NIW28700.1 hypothetical protein [Actinomycetota bacterium]NIX21162.1 hypothetical protein [Actinomycetota bacterium]
MARIDRRRLAVLLDGFSPDGGVGVVIDRIDEIAETPFSLGGERVWV